jgi:predicted O-methyltransferase YrrM/glycosyltransferase involved in cell wall biosynthesis
MATAARKASAKSRPPSSRKSVRKTAPRVSPSKTRASASTTIPDLTGGKRLIFALAAGRNGTAYLARLFAGLPGVTAVHEAEPTFSSAMRAVQADPHLAKAFWLREKLPAIRSTPSSIYIETSPLFSLGFLEPLIKTGVRPDAILLRRSLRIVARSLFSAGMIPARSEDGRRLLLTPDDPGVLPLPGWEHLNDYQLCFWHSLEMERRSRAYGQMLRDGGANVVETSLPALAAADGALALIEELELPLPREEWSEYFLACDDPSGLVDDPDSGFPENMLGDLEPYEQEVVRRTGFDPRAAEAGWAVPAARQAGRPARRRESDAAFPLISTTLLNWNRGDLLARTIESYLDTVSVPFELCVVDNGSTDSSRAVVEHFAKSVPQMRAMWLPENGGGASINHGLERSRGQLLHISENDLEYLPHWAERALDWFAVFPELGQLSLYGPVPTDDEVWILKHSTMWTARGRILYQAVGNVSASSMLRREIWERGVRVHNLPTPGTFVFPDDARLSDDVTMAGYRVAWADRRLVRNLGYTEEEFARRENYYGEGFRCNPSYSEENWRRKREEYRHRPNIERASFLYPGELFLPEKSAPSPECPTPQRWSMRDGWTAEVEVLEALYALVRLIKPCFVLETGAWHGRAAEAIGRALKANGIGQVDALESDADSARIAGERLRQAGLSDCARVVIGNTMEYAPAQPIQLLLLDSDIASRDAEFRRFAPHLARGALVVIHDAGSSQNSVRAGIEQFIREGKFTAGIWIGTPRGMFIAQAAEGIP